MNKGRFILKGSCPERARAIVRLLFQGNEDHGELVSLLKPIEKPPTPSTYCCYPEPVWETPAVEMRKHPLKPRKKRDKYGHEIS